MKEFVDRLVETVLTALNGAFGSPVLTEFLISMLPIVELRGAIPIGVQSGIPLVYAALLGFLGSSLVCPIIMLLLMPILNLLKKTKVFRRLAAFIERKFRGRAALLEDKAENVPAVSDAQDTPEEEIKLAKRRERRRLLGVYVFVAVPLPFTGVWTGSAVAVFLGLSFWKGLAAVVLGNLTAAAIITLLTYLFADYLSMIIMILAIAVVVIVIAFVLYEVISSAKKRKRTDGNKENY